MIQLTKKEIIITIPHPCPKDALLDLQKGIVKNLQHQYVHPDGIGNPTKEQNTSNYILLELLKATLDNSQLQEVRVRYLEKDQALFDMENIGVLVALLIRKSEE